MSFLIYTDVYVLFCIKNCVAATDFQIQLYAG